MDLFILCSDKNLQFALQGALNRSAALGIRPITYEIRVHSGRDGGVRTSGIDILELESSQHDVVIMAFDFEGSGAHEANAIDLEQRLDDELSNRLAIPSKAIVINPECDIWMWGSDNALSGVLGWNENYGIRQWLRNNGFEFNLHDKPLRPKEALDAIRKAQRKPRSSALYEKITSRISLSNCQDLSYLRLKLFLKNNFPENNNN